MRMQVSEHDNEVLIELHGVAGRQQHILQMLTQGAPGRPSVLGDTALDTTIIAVRAGNDGMRIRLKRRDGGLLQAGNIYRFLRQALLEAAPDPAALETLAGEARLAAI